MRNIIFIIISIFLFSCNTIETKDINIELLKKGWTNSYEEAINSTQIYRPSDYKDFPASRFRQTYIFADSGYCKYYVLSPSDAHYFEEGTWEYKENKTLNIFNPKQELIFSYKIITLNNNLLELLQLN